MAVKQGTDGKFVKGHTGGPGRPPRAREEKYYNLMMSTVTFADWERIISKAVEQAKRGDPTARKWLSDYLIGPPVERKEISGADSGPLQIMVVYAGDNNDETITD